MDELNEQYGSVNEQNEIIRKLLQCLPLFTALLQAPAAPLTSPKSL